jgi:hypothetical protein
LLLKNWGKKASKVICLSWHFGLLAFSLIISTYLRVQVPVRVEESFLHDTLLAFIKKVNLPSCKV